MNIKSGLKNISYSMIGQFITLIIGILIPRLIIVSYGSEINGLLSSTSTIISYLALLEAGVGAATCQALYKPIYEKNYQGINEILAATHAYYRRAGVAYLCLVIVISLLYPLTIDTSVDYGFVVSIIFLQGLPGIISFFFQRKYISFLTTLGKNYIVTNLQTLMTVVASLLKILLLQLGMNIVVVQAIYCVTSLCQMVFILYYIRCKYPWVNVKEKPNYKALQQKNAALIHQICSLVTNSTDVLVLSAFCSLQIVSIYTVYNMIFAIVYNMIFSVNSAVQYALGQAYCKGKAYYTKICDSYETFYVTIASALLLVTYILITPFLKLYTAGADINYINKYLPVLFVFVKIFNSFRNASINTITVSGQFQSTRCHAIVESVLNLSISILSVWKFGMVGVLLGTVVAFIYRCVVAIRFANIVILERTCTHSVRVIGLNLALVSLCIVATQCLHLELSFANYFTFFAGAICMTMVVLVVFCVLNALFDREAYYQVTRAVMQRLRNRGDR